MPTLPPKPQVDPNPFTADQMTLDLTHVPDTPAPTPPPAWQASDYGYETMERDRG